MEQQGFKYHAVCDDIVDAEKWSMVLYPLKRGYVCLSLRRKKYDVDDKQGFLEATVEFALKREELRGPFLEYLMMIAERESIGITKRQ